jgi:predicted Zn-dependent peptidase
MLNRLISPPLFTPTLPKITLGVQIEDYPKIIFVPSKEEVCRVELVFNAGLLNQTEKGTYACIKSLLFSGTHNKTEEQILNSLDSLGAYYGSEYDYNHFKVSLYSTPSLIHEALPIFVDAVFNAAFPTEKINTFRLKATAEYDQNQEKTGYLARVLCNKNFFETETLREPANKEDIQTINQKLICQEFGHLVNSGFTIFVSGNLENTQWLYKALQPYFKSNTPANTLIPQFSNKSKGHHHFHKNESVQTSLRAMALTIGKGHEDFSHTLLANMLFGGYFGSLLMQNIREEKGLTYGINSSLKAQHDYSILNVGSDIKSGSIDEVIAEINKEFENLCNGTFSDEMLEKTRSYTLGVLAKSCDDLFSDLEKTDSIVLDDLNPQYYHNLFTEIQKATKEDVVRAAKEHLNINELCFATCGSE